MALEGSAILDPAGIILDETGPSAGFAGCGDRIGLLVKMAHSRCQGVGSVEIMAAQIDLEQLGQHGGNLFFDRIPVAGHRLFDLPGCVFRYGDAHHDGSCNSDPLRAPQFEHRLRVFAVKRRFDGHGPGLVVLDDLADPFKNVPELVLLFFPLVEVEYAHFEQARLLVFHFDEGKTQYIGAWIDAKEAVNGIFLRISQLIRIMVCFAKVLLDGPIRIKNGKKNMRLPQKWRYRLFIILKLAAVAGLFVAVYHRLPDGVDRRAIWQTFATRMKSPDWYLLWATAALMPLNWALETWKWRALIGRTPGWPFRQAFGAVMAGTAVSLFTPGRIGEYGGRALLTPRVHLSRSIAAALAGSLAQWIVLTGGGCLGGFYLGEQRLGSDYSAYLYAGAGLVGLLAGAFLLADKGLVRVKDLLNRRRLSDRWIPSGFGRKNLSHALALAFLRYSVYSLQYVLLLYFFGLQAGFLPVFAGVALLFGVQTCLPLPPALGLAARAGAAVWLWSGFGGEPVGILGATLGLFIINLLTPSLLGLALIVTIKLKHTKNHEKFSHEDVGHPERVTASHGI